MEGQKIDINLNLIFGRGTCSIWICFGKIHWKNLPSNDYIIDDHKIYLLAAANNRPYVALSGCLYPPGETRIHELVELGRIASPKHYAPPPVILENGSVATKISFMEGLLGHQESVNLLFTECTFSFSKRLEFGFVAQKSWESCWAQRTTVCIIWQIIWKNTKVESKDLASGSETHQNSHLVNSLTYLNFSASKSFQLHTWKDWSLELVQIQNTPSLLCKLTRLTDISISLWPIVLRTLLHEVANK